MPDAVKASTDSTVLIEPMTEHDLLEVVEIERDCALSHWGWDAYHAELMAPMDSILLVAKEKGIKRSGDFPIIGFITGRCFADEVHVNNMAVRRDFRRQGIGQSLLRALLSWGEGKKASQAVLEVRAGNTAAQQLYRASGFEVVGRRRGYYMDPLEDALVMTVSLKQKP